MALLVDTNVLLRLLTQADAMHRPALDSIETLEEQGEALYVTSQNLIELWNVATRPADKNGLGQTPEAALHILSTLERAFSRLPELDRVYDIWRDLVIRFGVSGVKVHDTRLVAAMLVHDIPKILTLNAPDFERFSEIGIEVVDPRHL